MQQWQSILPKKRRILISLLVATLALSLFVPLWLMRAPSAKAQGTSCLSGTITQTNSWVTYWSTATVSYGQPVTAGSVIVACDPDGVMIGATTVTTTGEYGPLYAYGDDPTTPNVDEGAVAGDHVTFYVNGKKASPQGPDDPVWVSDKALENVDLVAPEGTVWYLAEGYTGGTFDTFILIQNPNSASATITTTYLIEGGSPIVRVHSVGANTRYTIDAKDSGQVGPGKGFSTKVEATLPIVVERAMYWNGFQGGHDSIGATSPSKTWYLAEGYTGGTFDTYILLQNPNSVSVAVTTTYLIEGGSPKVVTHTVDANKRYTIYANDAGQVGSGKGFSTKVEADRPIVVERAMYWNSFDGGHDSGGVTAPSRVWYLAEGYTGGTFDTYILVQNPNGSTATVTTTYLIQGGSPIVRVHTVDANKRYTIHADDVGQVGEGKGFSTKLEADQPIVAERAMYWNSFGGGHDSSAVTGPSNNWSLAEGYTGGTFDTYILIQNPNASTATVTTTYQIQGGSPLVRVHSVNANERYTILADDAGQVGTGKGFSTAVVADVPIVVERAMYWDNFAHGHDSHGFAP